MLNDENNWFDDWFNSPYYHILYQHRNNKEAESFINKLIDYLKPSLNNKFLDVACGKGRHAIYLNKLGYNVDGFDLAVNNIEEAKKAQSPCLSFFVNDIRKPLKLNHYDFAFNLFTSFGYFDDNNENQQAIDAITQSLKTNGYLILDFMNCNKIISTLVYEENITLSNINFKLNRHLKDGFIIKDIRFSDKGNNYHFQEKVKAISYKGFKQYFNKSNLKIERIFGDYQLTDFDEKNSERIILIARKL